MAGMKDLIEALTILSKYADEACPTHCEHDVLAVMGIEEGQVSKEDAARLDELGFIFGDCGWGDNYWYSYRFGSA